MAQSPLDANKNHPTPFTVPEGYFEDLPARIQQRIATSVPETPVAFFPRWAYYGLGAVAVLVTSLWFIVNISLSSDHPTATLPLDQQLAEIPQEELIDYLQGVDVDVMAVTPLTEEEQQTLLEQELSAYPISEEYFNETDDDYIEDFL